MSKLEVVGVGGVGALAFSYLLDDNSVNETQVNEKQSKIKSLLCKKRKKERNMRVYYTGPLQRGRASEPSFYI